PADLHPFPPHLIPPLYFSLIMPPHPSSTLFPYTTLFRSRQGQRYFMVDACEHFRLAMARPARVLVLRHARAAVSVDAIESMLELDRKSTRLNSSHRTISYAVFCLKKKKTLIARSTP